MGALKCATRSGSEIQLPHAAVDSFRSRVRGGVVGRGDDGYDRARVVFNAMIDRLPALIVQCAGAADVMEAVMFAREYDLLVSVRGGGHGVTGNAVCQDGLVIDVSRMRSVRVDRRFLAVTARLGLLQYWHSSGSWPDFCGDTQLSYDCRAAAARLLR